MDEGTPPPITPHNESAWKTIPLHNAIVLEALRLYPPNWLSQYRVSSGVLPLGSAQQDEERGPTTTVDDLIWLSPWGSHHNSESFPKESDFGLNVGRKPREPTPPSTPLLPLVIMDNHR